MNNNFPTKEELSKYYALGYSMKEIGEYLGYSAGKIHKYFHIYHIKPRQWGMKNEFARKKALQSKKRKTSSLRGKKISKEHIEKLKNKIVSEETKKKMSIAHTKKGIGHKKKRKDGYIAIYFPDHPKSNKEKYIMEHDLIMECYIGRWLKEEEIVHHINHKRDDNRIENLKLMTKKEHARLHMLERKRKEDIK